MSTRLFFLIVLLLSVLSMPMVAHGAFGISPPFVHATHLVKGSRFTQTLYLVQDQPNEDLRVRAAFDLPERIQSWITIDQGMEFVIPKGTRQFPVQLIIDVPRDAPLTEDNGNVTFTTLPDQAGQVTVALGVQASVSINVGEGAYRKFSLPVVDFLDIEEGWNPRVYVKFNNEGNVPEQITGGTLELLDQYGATRLAFAQKTGEFPEARPFTVEEFTFEFPINFHLGIGQYWGDVHLYQGEKEIGNQRTVFNVVERGALSSPMAQLIRFMQENWYYPSGVLALVVVGIWWLRKRKRRINA